MRHAGRAHGEGHEFMQNSARVHPLGIGSNGSLWHRYRCYWLLRIVVFDHQECAPRQRPGRPAPMGPLGLVHLLIPVSLTAIHNVTSAQVDSIDSLDPHSLRSEQVDGRKRRAARPDSGPPSFSACFGGRICDSPPAARNLLFPSPSFPFPFHLPSAFHRKHVRNTYLCAL